jgi:hypothetical protein
MKLVEARQHSELFPINIVVETNSTRHVIAVSMSFRLLLVGLIVWADR